MKQRGFFDEADRLAKLTKLGDALERLNKYIDWEIFRPILKEAMKKEPVKGPGGRPPYDSVLMFKTLILQKLYNISDDQAEYQINDRLSFMRFLGITLCNDVPDAKTIWLFREQLKEGDTAKKLFDLFEQKLEGEKIITHSGSIVDATFVDVPRQRNTREENKSIKEGDLPEAWEADEKMKSGEVAATKDEKAKWQKVAQKDVDARWAKKNNETHYGYKSHDKADADSKMIVDYVVTDAVVHDSKVIVDLLDEKDKVVYADSAYVGEELEKSIQEKVPDAEYKPIERAYRNKPLTEEQKAENKERSRIRVRVEHIFGYMTNSMNGIFVRSIGKARAACTIGLMNLTYNLSRYVCIKKMAAARV
jgi:IS5 family transposase